MTDIDEYFRVDERYLLVAKANVSQSLINVVLSLRERRDFVVVERLGISETCEA